MRDSTRFLIGPTTLVYRNSLETQRDDILTLGRPLHLSLEA
jgi:hypothetical protein